MSKKTRVKITEVLIWANIILSIIGLIGSSIIIFIGGPSPLGLFEIIFWITLLIHSTKDVLYWYKIEKDGILSE